MTGDSIEGMWVWGGIEGSGEFSNLVLVGVVSCLINRVLESNESQISNGSIIQ